MLTIQMSVRIRREIGCDSKNNDRYRSVLNRKFRNTL
jgi:hypothetical protein